MSSQKKWPRTLSAVLCVFESSGALFKFSFLALLLTFSKHTISIDGPQTEKTTSVFQYNRFLLRQCIYRCQWTGWYNTASENYSLPFLWLLLLIFESCRMEKAKRERNTMMVDIWRSRVRVRALLVMSYLTWASYLAWKQSCEV